MADDPREEVLAKRLAADQNDDAHWTGYLREAGLHIAALNVVDPLRALLADKDRAVEFAARARYEAWRATWLADGGSRLLTPPWEDIDAVMQLHWRAETDQACSAVLAALREVAGNG